MASSLPPPPPATIRALPQEIVDRIAAGEVVQRPCSIAKELIENSQDAGSASIEISCTKGGMESLQITDDGCGMSKNDLPLAAVRFATSKLFSFDDLKSIRTFGFRGEALASASMVSNLSILTKQASSEVAYKCQYMDGAVEKGFPKAAAGTNGTTVRVDNLFYNIPSRRKSFSKDSEEYNKVLDVAQRYAIHRAGDGIGMVCKKAKQKMVDLNTKSLPTVQKLMRHRKANRSNSASVTDQERVKAKKEAIGHIFGVEVSRELLTLDCGEGDILAVSEAAFKALQEGNLTTHDPDLPQFNFAYKCSGLFTNASYNVKQSSAAFLVFINDRLVECTGLKKAIEAVYYDLLPMKGKPFVYLTLEVPGPHVDVNVHPTKKEVAFLHEDRLCESIAIAVRKTLSSLTSSRSFKVSSVVPTAAQEAREKEREKVREKERESLGWGADGGSGKRKSSGSTLSAPPLTMSLASFSQPDPSMPHPTKKASTYNPSKMVRTSASAPQGALEPFLRSTQKNSGGGEKSSSTKPSPKTPTVRHDPSCEMYNMNMSMPGAFALVCRCGASTVITPPPSRRPTKVVATKCEYESIMALRADVGNRADKGLTEKLKTSTWVGSISRQRSLIQVGVELLMINHFELGRELFYQLALARFGGGAGKGGLGKGIEVQPCILQALCASDGVDGVEVEEEKKMHATEMTLVLKEKKDMLKEYFEVDLEKRGDSLWLTGLPVLLDGHYPAPNALPLFLMRLATEVDYTDEKGCFEGICSELGNFYAELPLEGGGVEAEEIIANNELIDEEAKKFVKHTLYPALAFLLVPPKEFATDGTVMRMALLSSLYKVFERC